MIKFILLLIFGVSVVHAADVRVGTKNFTEGYILGEIVSQVLEQNPEINVERKFGLGGTGIVYQALINNEIDLYVDYSGTLSESILKRAELTNIVSLRAALE
jgi:glycine betaine/choline ABC-type transport system substrate-binding protein